MSLPTIRRERNLIAIIGDTQRTLLIERWALRREQNADAPLRLMKEIAELQPDAVIHLGDMVARGSRAGEWERFDRLAGPAVRAGIPLFPAIGNHDRWGNARRAAAHLRARFPWFADGGWYARHYGPLRLLWLDTNAGSLTSRQWTGQTQWFADQLAQADRDDATAGVVVIGHHPPFTNGRATSDALHVQDAFVRPFCACRKTLAFLSGHTHAYEHFFESGKTFIVSGGGGGPRVRLRRGPACRHVDLYQSKAPIPFHFLTLQPIDVGIRISVRGFRTESEATEELDRFDIGAA